MSRHPKPIPKGPAFAKQDAPDPAQVTPVTPVPTDAASADAKAAAEAAAASVDPKTDAPPVPPEAKAEAPKTKKPAQPVVLRVKGPANGRWRAGRHFTPEPVDIPMADLSDEDLLKLKGDPALTCTVIGAPA